MILVEYILTQPAGVDEEDFIAALGQFGFVLSELEKYQTLQFDIEVSHGITFGFVTTICEDDATPEILAEGVDNCLVSMMLSDPENFMEE